MVKKMNIVNVPVVDELANILGVDEKNKWAKINGRKLSDAASAAQNALIAAQSAVTTAQTAMSGSVKGLNAQLATWLNLKNLRDTSALVPGTFYRITDYVTTTAQVETMSAGHAFDIIVRADSESVLNENAFAIEHKGSNYFSKSKLSAWRLKYSLDNDTSRFLWADTENGKGVIYYMRDEFDNEAPYDFKNILFKRYLCISAPAGLENIYEDNYYCWDPNNNDISGDEDDFVWYYTFATEEDPNVDFSLNINHPSSKLYKSDTCFCSDNVILKNIVTVSVDDGLFLTPQSLNNIVLLSGYNDEGGYSNIINNRFGSRNHDMTFFGGCETVTTGERCYDMSGNLGFCSFGSKCYSNFFGVATNANQFGSYVIGNSFGSDVAYNSFGSDIRSNVFGSAISSNSFGSNIYHNSFGSNIDSNVFGSAISYNQFGSNIEGNLFGSYVQNNKFSSGVSSNSFGSNIYHNSFGSNIDSNVFGSAISYNQFGSNIEGNLFGSYVQNNKFSSGVSSNSFGSYVQNNNFGSAISYNQFGSNIISVKISFDYFSNNTVCNGVSYVDITCSVAGNNNVQNVMIYSGVGGSYNERLTLEIPTRGGSLIEVKPSAAEVIEI